MRSTSVLDAASRLPSEDTLDTASGELVPLRILSCRAASNRANCCTLLISVSSDGAGALYSQVAINEPDGLARDKHAAALAKANVSSVWVRIN